MKRLAQTRPARIAATIVVALVALPSVLYLLPQTAGADHSFVVLSGSMVPTFLPGDVIFVEEVAPDSLQVGDVITFRAKEGSKTLITHRIIERLEDGGTVRYRTQGDANEDPDPFVVKQTMVVGLYEWHLPYWGLLVKALKTKVGYFLLVLIPAGSVIILEMVKLYRELDAWDRDRQAKKRPPARATTVFTLLRVRDPKEGAP